MILKSLLYVGGGAVAGFVLYKLVGCPTGTCPLTRTPLNSITFGAVIGLLLSFSK